MEAINNHVYFTRGRHPRYSHTAVKVVYMLAIRNEQINVWSTKGNI